MEQTTQKMITSKWLIGILLILLIILVGLNYTGFCFIKMRYVQDQEFIDDCTRNILMDIRGQHTLIHKEDKEDNSFDYEAQQYYNRIKKFLAKYPNCSHVNHYRDVTTAEAFYFYSPQEIEQAKQSLINEEQKLIVGYSYEGSYSSCGDFEGAEAGEGGDILQGDEEDVKYNPYRKNK